MSRTADTRITVTYSDGTWPGYYVSYRGIDFGPYTLAAAIGEVARFMAEQPNADTGTSDRNASPALRGTLVGRTASRLATNGITGHGGYSPRRTM